MALKIRLARAGTTKRPYYHAPARPSPKRRAPTGQRSARAGTSRGQSSPATAGASTSPGAGVFGSGRPSTGMAIQSSSADPQVWITGK